MNFSARCTKSYGIHTIELYFQYELRLKMHAVCVCVCVCVCVDREIGGERQTSREESKHEKRSKKKF